MIRGRSSPKAAFPARLMVLGASLLAGMPLDAAVSNATPTQVLAKLELYAKISVAIQRRATSALTLDPVGVNLRNVSRPASMPPVVMIACRATAYPIHVPPLSIAGRFERGLSPRLISLFLRLTPETRGAPPPLALAMPCQSPNSRGAPPPPALVISVATADQSYIDELLLANLIDDLKTGRRNKRSPELRRELAGFLADIPFTTDAYMAFQYMLEGSVGNTVQKRTANLTAWAQQYSDGRYAAIIAYYTAYHYCKIKKTDMALACIEEYRNKYREYPDRICLLQALCFIQKKERPKAMAMLRNIREDYPKSPVLPETLFLSAWILFLDDNLPDSNAMLAELLAKYPASYSARKALEFKKELSSAKAESFRQ